MDRLAIEHICALGMPPADFVRLVAELGVRKVGLAPAPITDNPHGFPAWDLRQDPALLRDTASALSDNGVSLSVGEGYLVLPGVEIAATAAPTLDVHSALGATRINCVMIEQDRSRALDQFAQLAAMAAERGMELTLEFMPMMWPMALAEAAELVRASGAGNTRLMVDAMHLYRSGGSADDVRALGDLVGYAQVCDVPMPAQTADYGEEARNDRLCPGDGDLPLAAFVAALPAGIPIGLEVPMVSRARAGMTVADAMRLVVERGRALTG